MENDYENMIQERTRRKVDFTEDEIKLCVFQVLKGLEYIHSKSKSPFP